MSHGRRTLLGLLAWLGMQGPAVSEVHLLDPGSLSPHPGETLTLQFHVEGLPEGARVSVRGLSGRAQARPVTQPELLVVDYQVTKGPVPLVDTLTLRARSLELEHSVEIDLQPPALAVGELRLAPDRIESRPGGAAYVEIRAPKHTDVAPWLRASIGEVGPPKSDGEEWVWTWSTGELPEASAVVGFMSVDPSRPQYPEARGTLPIHITQSLTLTAPPGYICELAQGDHQSEGVPVTPAGTLAMNVAVDPTETLATVDCTNPVGQTRQYPVELQLGNVPHFVMGAVPPVVPADSGSPLPIHILSLEPNGKPAMFPTAQIRADRGRLSELEATPHPGIWRAWWTSEGTPGSVTLTAEVAEHSQAQEFSSVATTESLSIQVSPASVSSRSTPVEFSVSVKSTGAEVPAEAAGLSARGGRSVNSFQKTEAGGSQKFRLGTEQPGIWVLGNPPSTPLGLPAVQILAWSPSPVFIADGEAETPVIIAVTDALGEGVANVTASLSIDRPERGTLRSGTVTTQPNGLAWVWVRSGTEDGPFQLLASIDGDRATAPLYALPADDSICATSPQRCQPMSFVIDGDAASRDFESRWRERAPLSWVPYREAPLEPVAATELAAPAAPGLEAPQTPDTPNGFSTVETSEARHPTAPTAPLPPTEGSEGARLRLSLAAASMSHVYSAATKNGAAAPTPHDYQRGNLLNGNPLGSLAGAGHLLIRAGPVTVDGGVQASKIHLGSDSGLAPTAFYQGWLGVRKAHGLSNRLQAHLGLAADYQTFHVLVYDVSSPGQVMVSELATPGARLSAGMSWTQENIWAELEVSEAWTPWPVRTTGSLRFHIPIADYLTTSIGLDMSFRSARISAGADELSLEDQFHFLSFGLGTALP